MILPFVRELFADVEKSAAFARAVARVKGGAGRVRVSGLTPTGKALFYALLQRSTSRPVIVIVSDNRAVDELLPGVRSLGDLTGAVVPQVCSRPPRALYPSSVGPAPRCMNSCGTGPPWANC